MVALIDKLVTEKIKDHTHRDPSPLEQIVRNEKSGKIHRVAVGPSSKPRVHMTLLFADGNLAGPFTRVKVSPIQNSGRTSNIMKLPIQTFFPIQLANPAS